ncbi:methyltransferase [Amycolatopsis magusensis]|uniref:methyltransferase n=1 Tax=Amycolatopsis magusensis TaxID=882444 RepID=UPI003C30266A
MEIAKLAVSGWFARALGVAAELGLADILDGGAMSSEELARRTDSHPDVMLRLLQMLTVPGVVVRDDNGDFKIGEAFEALRSDHPISQRNFAILSAGLYDDAFAELGYTVRTGKSGFEKRFGATLYEYLEQQPETADLFDRGMVDLARPVGHELAKHHDFSGVRKVIDVGGGSGGLLPGILAVNPEIQGVVADRASVCERGKAKLAEVDPALAKRISFAPADFFAEVPTGGDRYVLKNVLHDWTFDNCVRILGTVAKAIAASDRPGRLLVVEPLVESDFDGWRAMFQVLACDEGTLGLDEDEMRKALGEAGFAVLSVTRLLTGHKVLECELAAG